MSSKVSLDDMLDPGQAAKWFGIHRRVLARKSRGRKPQIVAFRLSRKLTLYHPRTVIAKLAHDAGVPPEVIAASMTIQGKDTDQCQ